MAIAKHGILRMVYLYLVTAIAIVLMMISSIGLLHLVLKTYVFNVKSWEELNKDYWECEPGTLLFYPDKSGTQIEKYPNLTPEQRDAKIQECKVRIDAQRQLTADNNRKDQLTLWLSMLIVSLPVYVYHWRLIRRAAS